MKINPYLIFNGDCKAAFTFYEQCLQGKIEAMIPSAKHLPPSTSRKNIIT